MEGNTFESAKSILARPPDSFCCPEGQLDQSGTGNWIRLNSHERWLRGECLSGRRQPAVNLHHFNGQTLIIFRCEAGLSEAEQLILFLYDVVLYKIVEFSAGQPHVIEPARLGSRWLI